MVAFFTVAGCLFCGWAIWLATFGVNDCEERVRQAGGDCEGIGAGVLALGVLGLVLLAIAAVVYAAGDPARKRDKG